MGNFMKDVTPFQFLLTFNDFDETNFPGASGFTSLLCAWIFKSVNFSPIRTPVQQEPQPPHS